MVTETAFCVDNPDANVTRQRITSAIILTKFVQNNIKQIKGLCMLLSSKDCHNAKKIHLPLTLLFGLSSVTVSTVDVTAAPLWKGLCPPSLFKVCEENKTLDGV